MRVEIVAVGTELLLGQIIDTNSAHIGQRLAASGIDCQYQTRVGDNIGRIAEVLRAALDRSDAVIACGGLGPTQDDVTREAIASVMGVGLERDPDVLAVIEALFTRRQRSMSMNNARQADVPVGAEVIPQRTGTAPGLICPVGDKVIYATPGVPAEMHEMLERAILPDLRRRAGQPSVIVSRTLRTWGLSESGLAELIAPRIDALEAASVDGARGVPTIAFLASGIEGIKVRLTVKSQQTTAAHAALDAEEAELRALLGDVVFGVDEETMESAVGRLLVERSLVLGVAESCTGGLIAARSVAIPGASRWFAGGVVTYATRSKVDLLGLADGPVVTAEAAMAMAEGVRRLFHCEVGLSTTGAAGPDADEGVDPGTVFVGIAIEGRAPESVTVQLPGDRSVVRQLGTISALDQLRRRLALD